MKLTTYIKRIFYKLTFILLTLNILTASFLFYHYSFNLIGKEELKLNQLIEQEKSYLIYNLLSGKSDDVVNDFIDKVNKQLSLIKISIKNSDSSFFLKNKISLNFAGKELLNFYPYLSFDLKALTVPILVICTYFFISIGVLFIVFKKLKIKIQSQIVIPLIDLDNYFINGLKNFPSSDNLEILELERSFKNISTSLNNYIKEKEKSGELEKSAALGSMAKQIAHDIRSPLEALRSLSEKLDELDYHVKLILTNSIGRISDIANGLLRSGKEDKEKFKDENLSMIIDDLILDKRYEKDIIINFENDLLYTQSYIQGSENQLYRAFSNIINNGIEAQNGQPKIDISLKREGDILILRIRDYGEGMRADTIETFLKGGVTTKENGNGLGLSYAKQVVQDHNGKLTIESELGRGTDITITLKSIDSPGWLVDKIFISYRSKRVVCIDDDYSFLQLYKDKLKGIKAEVETYKTLSADNLDISYDTQYFFDYDLAGDKTGLDLIVENGLASVSTLVTSMYQDPRVQKLCVLQGIKILPKQMFNKATVVELNEEESLKKYVLIDDDDLTHLSWKLEAKRKKVSLNIFSDIDSFLTVSNQFSREVIIYIDSSLGNGVKGEVESERIAKLGFSEIHLSTGYPPNSINRPAWIKSIVGKKPPF